MTPELNALIAKAAEYITDHPGYAFGWFLLGIVAVRIVWHLF